MAELFIMGDRTLIQFGDAEHDSSRMLGEHDDEGAEPHRHWGIYRLEDGELFLKDWGYHSKEEAEKHGM